LAAYDLCLATRETFSNLHKGFLVEQEKN